MNRLENVSFVIPVRIDSQERKRNLNLLLEFITAYFSSPIYIVEGDAKQQYKNKSTGRQVNYHFVKDDNPVFQHTRYLNYLYQHTQTPIIAGWDTDVMLPPEQIIDTVYQIESGNSVMGSPYNGIMYGTNPLQVQLFQNSKDINILKHNIPYMYPMYGSLSLGGAFIVNAKEYLRSGGDNEHFLGWGPEDLERIKRMEILYPNHSIYRSPGCLFHLWHPRLHNSWYANEEYEIAGKQEFLKICSMTAEELRMYVNSWSWRKQ